jgi:hypothetical protein
MLQEQKDKEEVPASAFLFEMFWSCKDPWMGGKVIKSRKGKFQSILLSLI